MKNSLDDRSSSVRFLHFNFRLAASLSANASTTPRTPTPTIEEKLGLPTRPKRPLTPYFRFLKSIRPQMAVENPSKSAIELVQMISKKWETVDDRQKEKFAQEYRKDKEEYVKKHAIYDSKLTEVQKQELQLAKEDRVHDKVKRAYRKVSLVASNGEHRSSICTFVENPRERQAEETAIRLLALSQGCIRQEGGRRYALPRSAQEDR